jgi:hypothetical protein
MAKLRELERPVDSAYSRLEITASNRHVLRRKKNVPVSCHPVSCHRGVVMVAGVFLSWGGGYRVKMGLPVVT